jgi:hypothetical protein
MNRSLSPVHAETLLKRNQLLKALILKFAALAIRFIPESKSSSIAPVVSNGFKNAMLTLTKNHNFYSLNFLSGRKRIIPYLSVFL